MGIKVNEFSIQAKVIEEDSLEIEADKDGNKIPDSVRKEIIDECLEKLKEYLERKGHLRRVL